MAASLDNEVQAWVASQGKTGTAGVDYRLFDHSDGNGPVIGFWNTMTLGPQPTSDQLATVATQAQAIADAAAAAILCDQVDKIRDTRLATGWTDSGPGGTGKTYPCDDKSIGRWTAMAASAQPFALGIAPGGVTPPTYQPIPSDNSIPSPMTALAIYSLFEGRVMAWVSATAIYARTMKNAIIAGTPPADITQGWPQSSP